MALTFTALGGVYLAGGIVREFGQRFVESGFRTRFEDKGRFRQFLEPIPVFQIAQHTLVANGWLAAA
jgi:glucokinase